MKTKLQLPLFTFLIALFSFAFTADGWGQGLETFDNSSLTTTYAIGSFVGNGGITWSYVHSRDESTYPINGKGLMLRRSDEPSSISASITGGIGDFSVDTRKAFTGNNQRRIELVINGIVIQQFEPAFADGADATVIPFSVNNINIAGVFTLELRLYGVIGNQQITIDNISWTAFSAGTPLLSASPSTITGMDYILGAGPSSSQSFNVSGLSLDPAAGNINVAAPTNFEVSTDDITFSSTVNLPYTGGELTATPVYVRLQSGLAINTYSGDVTISGGNATNVTVAVSGEVSPVPTPTLTVNPTALMGLNYMEGSGPSSVQTFVLSGDALTGNDVNITVPAQFEISTDNVTYFGALLLPAYNGSNTTIYVRLVAGLAENTFNANADITGGGATAIAVSLQGNVTPLIAPYTGTGVFELITSVTDLTDGYYVIAEATDAFAMNNLHNGTFLAPEAITLVGNTIVNPGTHLAWLIEADGAGHKIYNDGIAKYVSYTGTGNNIQIVDNVTADNQRWSITYNVNDEFEFANVAIPARILQYNASLPRFVAYTSNQVKLHLYKYIEVNDPVLTASPLDLNGLNYIEGAGPSDSQTFEVSGLNMDGTNVTINLNTSNFELSLDDVVFSNSLTLTAFDGTATTVYVRLIAGLAINNYNDVINITGGGAADPVQVTVVGSVIEPFDLPYFNGLRNQSDWDEATIYGFAFNGTSFATGAGGYVAIPNGASIVSPAIDFADYNLLIASFNLASLGSGTGRELTVFVSNDDGLNYTALETFTADQGSSPYITFTQYINVSALNGANGRIKFEMTAGNNNSIRFRDLDLDGFDGYFFRNNNWVPANPSAGVSTTTDNILIVDGTATLTGDTAANNITVNDSATLNLEGVLNAAGDINVNGDLVFISNATTTGQLDTFSGMVNGEVTIQRYIPARRAFRLLSSSVSTTGSIRANWQEGVNNTGTNFPADNLDPNPGFGTHITGSMTGDNGFDASPAGNPSLFTLNNATQLWEGIDNTDVNTIAAGTPYRLMVRGDRSIDVTSNGVTPTNTVLRTTGTLHTGTFTTTDFSQVQDEFNFFGNPYPATVDMNAVLSTPNNVNPNSYYIWDPNMNTRGAYVAVDLPTGSSPIGSAANEYLQPGQAAFVTTLANGPAALTFEESHKAVTQPLTQVFSIMSKIDLRLYTASAFAQNESAADALRIKFDDTYSNGLTPLDASKFLNLDENLATNNSGSLLSIESRKLPLDGEIIPLFIDQYRTTDYVFEAHLSEVNDIVTLLKDHFTGTTTALLNNDISLYAFQVDDSNPLSIAEDRFEIVFEEFLSAGNMSFGNGFVLFPNPAQGEINIATRGIAGQEVQLSITSILGQLVYNNTLTVNPNGMLSLDASRFANGVYILKLTGANGGQFTTKFVKR